MKEKRRGLLKERRGMALLFVLCLLALLMAIGASMLFAAASAVAHAAQSAAYEQASLSAESFCTVIRRELVNKDSELKKIADSLDAGDELPLSAVLPGSMGEVKDASLRRTDDETAILAVTAESRGKQCNITMIMERKEDENIISPGTPGDEGTGDPVTETVVSWRFSGFMSPGVAQE